MNSLKISLTCLLTVVGGAFTLCGQYASPVVEYQSEQVWNDPVFVEKFLGSYGFLSDAEPKINKDEIEMFRDLLPLIKENPSAAATRLQEEVNEDSSAAMYFILGNLYFQNKQLEEAEQNYEKALEKFPDYRRAHKNLALVLLQDQKTDEAAKHINRAIELGEKDGRNYGLLGYIYLDEGNFIAAQSAYREAILQEPEVADWKLGLARSLLGMEQYEEANALFETLIAENPEKPDYWLLQVNTLLGMNKPERAVANLEILRRMGKAKPSNLKLLGDIYMNMQMQDQALAVYDELIASDADANYLESSLRIGEILVQTQDYDRAMAMLGKIESNYTSLSDEQQLGVLNLKAKVARAQGNEELAKSTLESIIDRDPLNGDALLELASYHESKGEFEEAVFLYQSAAKVKGFEYRALVKQAQMLVKEKKYADAVPLLKNALTYRDDPRIREYLERVERAARNA